MKLYGGNGRRPQKPRKDSADGKSGHKNDNYINSDKGYNNKENENQKTSKSNKSPKNKVLKVVLIIILVIGLLAGGVSAYWLITTKPPEIDINQGNDDQEDTVNIIDTPTREIGHYYTVLVVGIDQEGLNTDTIMLGRYDAVLRNVNVVSIPRDTLVNVPWSTKKINSVYYSGGDGIESLKDAVQDICGFRPDNHVVIDTDAFIEIIDTLGGVYFDVPIDMNYDDIAPEKNYVYSIHIKKGYQLLNGENALGVFRFRQNNDGTGYPMGDIDRIQVQHDLINACADQMLKLGNIDKLLSVAKILNDKSETDLSYGNMQWYAQNFLKMSMQDINLMTLPGNYCCEIRGGSYASIYVNEWIDMVNQYFNPNKNPIKPEDCNILYQISPDTTYDPNPANYAVTNGGEIAGGINSFQKYKKSR